MTEYPLSPAQQAIWFEDQVDPGVGNTGFFGVTLLGELCEDHVRAACAAAVAQHSTMRTILRMRGDEPVLAVLPPTEPLRYETADCPCAPGEEVAATRTWRDRHTAHRFDLAAGPPVRFVLLRHGPDRRSLLVVAHHIGYDGRSKFAFAHTFSAALGDLRAGRVPQSAPLPWPHWPTAADEAVQAASAYWQAAGVEAYPPLRLPRGDGAGVVATTGEFFVDGATRDRLVKLAEEYGVGLFAVMLAGVVITLYGYGNRRMVLCAPVDVTTAQTRRLIGLGVNIVPFTVDVEDTDTVASVLARTSAVRAHLKAYGAVPFQTLSVGKGWSAGSRALFSRLAVSYMRMATDVPTVPGLATEWDFVAHNTARTFDLMIHMRDAYDRLVIRLDHAGADLDATAAAAIAEHLRHVLAELADHPSTALGARAVVATESTVAAPHGRPARDWLSDHLGLVAATTVFAPYRMLRDLARDIPSSLRDVVTPMAYLRPSADIIALVRAGVRLHALYTDSRGSPVAVQTCDPDDLARGYTPVLRDLAPGVRISVQGPDGYALPYGITGDLVIESPERERTGDLAEMDSGGTVRFHGPAGLVVEWAGQRLEIAALERYLMIHRDVDEAVVVCAQHRPVAYVVPRNGSGLDERAVRLHLRRRAVQREPRLSRVYVVPSLPRSADGEIDRYALGSGP